MRLKLVLMSSAVMLLVGAGVACAKEQIVLVWRDTPSEITALKHAAEAFQRKYGITVKITPFAWGEGDDKVFTMFASGIAPDLFTSVYRSGIADYAERGLVADLTAFIKRDKVDLKQFFPSILKHLNRGGKQLSLPDHGGVTLMWYNTSLFEQAGLRPLPTDWADSTWTWDAMVETATKLTRDLNGDGKSDQFGVFWNSWPVTVNAWLWGGDFFPESIYDDGVARKSTVTSLPAVTAVQKIADLSLKYRVAGGSFLQGKTAMAASGSWDLEDTINAKGMKVKLATAVLPRGTADRRPTIFTNPWMIARGSKHKEAAWKWIRFCTLEEGADILTTQYRFPIINRRGVPLHMKRFESVPAYAKVFAGALEVGQESPNHTIANFGEVSLAIETEANKAISGRLSASDAMKNLEPKLNSILQRTYTHFRK